MRIPKVFVPQRSTCWQKTYRHTSGVNASAAPGTPVRASLGCRPIRSACDAPNPSAARPPRPLLLPAPSRPIQPAQRAGEGVTPWQAAGRTGQEIHQACTDRGQGARAWKAPVLRLIQPLRGDRNRGELVTNASAQPRDHLVAAIRDASGKPASTPSRTQCTPVKQFNDRPGPSVRNNNVGLHDPPRRSSTCAKPSKARDAADSSPNAQRQSAAEQATTYTSGTAANPLHRRRPPSPVTGRRGRPALSTPHPAPRTPRTAPCWSTT